MNHQSKCHSVIDYTWWIRYNNFLLITNVFSSLLTAALEQNLRITNIRCSECIYFRYSWHFVRTRLQNSRYFCILKYAREGKQKVWNEAENRDPDWGETLNMFFSRLTRPTGEWGSRASRTWDSYATLYRFLYWFWEKTDCFAVYVRTGCHCITISTRLAKKCFYFIYLNSV